jgi:3-keto-L-gulonate-6-phosphate decarboxylase
MIGPIAMMGMIICGVIIGIAAIAAISSGVNLVSNLDNAACINMIANDTYITQTSDGFLGTETHYFITGRDAQSFELETNRNMTSIQRWNEIRNGDTIPVRESINYFVFCDQPKFIPEGL